VRAGANHPARTTRPARPEGEWLQGPRHCRSATRPARCRCASLASASTSASGERPPRGGAAAAPRRGRAARRAPGRGAGRRRGPGRARGAGTAGASPWSHYRLRPARPGAAVKRLRCAAPNGRKGRRARTARTAGSAVAPWCPAVSRIGSRCAAGRRPAPRNLCRQCLPIRARRGWRAARRAPSY
jgi:hypothetical protein